MRKKNNMLWPSISIIILVVAMSLTGCSKLQTKINLTGESENWRGELDTTVTNEREENGEYVITYNKDNWEDIKGYKININEGRIIREENGLASNSIKFPIIRKQGSTISTQKDQTIVILWTDVNGKDFEEKMILKSK
ncbi:hypothetical protein C0Q44_00255 [Paenibacillus sp. PCH8]|uniref:hypothetical protein n=1 Tax=Paenibacillus sp. PCH8 TaxID=2066524 RepID=UPI000CF849BA|nr:hypothetical protein [Paenibacillus sp. PCH8]PQP83204.1 hypothetical protein C0Q44_00255 [Paenibacillus sp. PCH8]